MIQKNNGHSLALASNSLTLPQLDISAIRNWIDYGLWGLLFYDDQSPWLTLTECLQILHYRKSLPDEPLFRPPSVGLDGQMQHEQIAYEVPLNFHLRHFLFRDREIAAAAAQHSLDVGSQWEVFVKRTRTWSDFDREELDVAYLRDRFEDVLSVQRALDILRSTEIDPFSSRRWTSRHLLPLGPDLLFADVRERSYAGDRRFMRRTGEILYLMLGRAEPDIRNRLTELLERRLLSTKAPWNELAAQIQPPARSKRKTVPFKTGYLPFARLEIYDRLARDWVSILSLERMDIAESLDPLMRISALHQVIYILHRAQETRGLDARSFPPFVFDLTASARRNPVQRIALGQYDSHMKLPRHAIDAYIDAFAELPCWKQIDGSTSRSSEANKLLAEMWLWPRGKAKPSEKSGTAAERLDEFRAEALARTGHSIWSVIANHTRLAGLVVVQRGAGTWYAPDDAMLEALVLANVDGPLELGEFLRTLFERYRIVIGQEQAQQAFGQGAMFLERLKHNEQRLEERLRVLGFIDRKSDACAFVVNPFYEAATPA